jgi:hypothetical protein
VVAAFEAILAGAPEDYRLGRGPLFTLHAVGESDAIESDEQLPATVRSGSAPAAVASFA